MLGAVALGLAGLALFGLIVGLTAPSLPDYSALRTQQKGQSVIIRGLDGAPLATIGPSYGEWLRYDEIPDVMVTAMVAVEDRRYWNHPGIDPIGIARAMVRNLKAGRFAQGGSTITQQVVKNIFLTSDRSFVRKLRELVLAPAMEVRFSKEQILEIYLNRVYFGGGAYGIDAASRRFFGHSGRRLALPEAAVIAGLVKAPTRFAPSSSPAQARSRARIVLQAMVETGHLTQGQARRVDMDGLAFARQPRENGVRYFTDWVLSQVETLVDETEKPLDVATTLDPVLQSAAERALRDQTPQGVQAALLALAYDGAIRAMIGGVDYVSSTYNRTILARRQPGSAFKLFVYLAALEAGLKPDDVREDSPVSFGGWTPVNASRGYQGPVSLITAFAQSINTVAVKLADEVGFDTVAAMARRLGVSDRISTQPAMALGASEVTLMDMTTAYGVVARGGTGVSPYGIREIRTVDGAVLYRAPEPASEQLLEPEVAAQMTRMLMAAVDRGTARAARLDRSVAGKTGTTQENRDGWFLGFTADLTTGVWMGRDDARPAPGLSGGKAPARAWAAFMRAASEGLPAAPLVAEVDTSGGEPDADAYGVVDEPAPFEPAPPPPGIDQGTDGAREIPPAGGDAAEPAPPAPPRPAAGTLDDAWLNRAVRPSADGVQQRPVRP